MPSHELCDVQNEESAKLIYDLKMGITKLPVNQTYNPGKGPNPDFHDTGIGFLKEVGKKDTFKA